MSAQQPAVVMIKTIVKHKNEIFNTENLGATKLYSVYVYTFGVCGKALCLFGRGWLYMAEWELRSAVAIYMNLTQLRLKLTIAFNTLNKSTHAEAPKENNLFLYLIEFYRLPDVN